MKNRVYSSTVNLESALNPNPKGKCDFFWHWDIAKHINKMNYPHRDKFCNNI